MTDTRTLSRTRGVVWSLSAVVCAAFAAFLTWLQATQELGFLIHDSHIVAGIFAAASICLTVYAIRNFRRCSATGVVGGAVLFCGVILVLVTLPGRLLQMRRACAIYGSACERSAHIALGLLVSAQEDQRIRTGAYARVLGDLTSPLLCETAPDAQLSITRADGVSWHGESRIRDTKCFVEIEALSTPVSHAHRNFLDDEIVCSDTVVAARSADPPPETMRVPPRSHERPSVARVAAAVRGEWLQERADPARLGSVRDSAPAARWKTTVGGSIRAGASVVGGVVLVGAHGTGWLGALDQATGKVLWHTRAPNWIHQNPVAKSGLVAVGLGDKDRLLAGDPVGLGISGVAAYDLKTGTLRWFARSEGSVMIAPVIWKNHVVSADGAGNLDSHDLDSGSLIWRRRMPGYAVMASPALRDSTVFVAQAHRFLCAYLASSGQEQWCYEAPREFRIGGDPTPSVIGGTVYWSVSHDSTGLELLAAGGSSIRRYVLEKLRGRHSERSSQWGSSQWMSPADVNAGGGNWVAVTIRGATWPVPRRPFATWC